MANKGTAAIGFIFITLMIDITGLGLIIPVMPALIKELTGEGISRASEYGGWLVFTFAVMQFLFSPVLGGLSDQYGRRPIILIALFGFAIDYLLLAFAPTLLWLFIGRALAGVTGASITTATAYIADISTKENRAQNKIKRTECTLKILSVPKNYDRKPVQRTCIRDSYSGQTPIGVVFSYHGASVANT
jgi:DHA1 family tetracycline resistance protein-like MFS transporter